ncbi:26S proteasome non-ATPase regulatory subunit 1-like [Oppia nitens]|uniref:26S proteasome non-ATPase regulatory subunit 1-like n=1 Tax=Oppia nitens TaxID=1686743 RepID=UPI0023DAB78D|nr:26S proteasome non-ATPase regulatory subunit 1-like [Oppia nitens]
MAVKTQQVRHDMSNVTSAVRKSAAAAVDDIYPTFNITSASGIISLLDEDNSELRVFALRKLNTIVDVFWPEISEIIEKVEMLYEDHSFGERKLAALVASKVYYHLGAFEDSLTYALGAEELFDVTHSCEYVDTIIAKCIDYYTKLRVQQFASETAGESSLAAGPLASIDPRLEKIVNRMFQRCFDDNHYKQAIGIALETRRMDIFKRAITESGDMASVLNYAFKITMSLMENRHFRNDILKILVSLYRNLEVPDFVSMTQCLIFLDDAQSVAEVLDRLSKGSDDNTLMAYQIAFDLYESATQQFLTRVVQALQTGAPIPALIAKLNKQNETKPQASAAAAASSETTTAETTATTTTTAGTTEVEKMETDDQSSPTAAAAEKSETTSSPVAETTTPKSEIPIPKLEDLSEDEKQRQKRLEKLAIILSGETTIELQLQFLIRNNHSDLLILKNTKDTVRNSICHNATVIANALTHCGTTSDQFLRDNLDWLARAVNWAKFSATASLGVIHIRHEKEALHLMASYLPRDSGPGSGYTEGGGLYALGLIHANHGSAIIDYLVNQLKDASNEAVRHGGCLGLGLAAMGTNRSDVYEILKSNLFQDDAITGEAAGIAMGLVMLGSKSNATITDMVSYAQETQHEKILRGLAVGIGLTMFGRLEEADTLIESLCRDKDPLLRRSGMHTIAMAYCGTGNNKAIRRLLHVAVSDVNDDVRRAAVEAIGFLLFRTPEQCPSVVSLLSESYNPNVRYGAAMALGICCAGTGNKEAIALLEPMTNDPVNFVRQGALISSALILVQQTEATCPKVKEFRQLYVKVISDKHDDVMAKFGAILAQGIIDAGGRNCTVALQSRTGHTNMPAVVGMLVFTQFWYWYPLTHFISLAFAPTAVIGLNSDLKMPKMSMKSNAKPSLYGYPAPLEEKKEKEREKVSTAVLSITAKAKRKEAEKKEQKDGEKMDIDSDAKDSKDKDTKETKTKESTATTTTKVADKDAAKESTTATTASAAAAKDTTKDGVKPSTSATKDSTTSSSKDKEAAATTVAKEPEPTSEMLENPARVVRQQLKVVSVADGCRYQPIKELSIGGIIMLKDTDRKEPEILVEPVAAGGPKVEDDTEPEPPEPFEYIED